MLMLTLMEALHYQDQFLIEPETLRFLRDRLMPSLGHLLGAAILIAKKCGTAVYVRVKHVYLTCTRPNWYRGDTNLVRIS
jgi:hypothetical protein